MSSTTTTGVRVSRSHLLYAAKKSIRHPAGAARIATMRLKQNSLPTALLGLSGNPTLPSARKHRDSLALANNLVAGWPCRKSLERRIDEGCALAFSALPFTLLAAVFDLQWIGWPDYRKAEYEASRGLFRFTVVIEGVEVEFISTWNIGEFQDLHNQLTDGTLSQSDPLGQRLNGYGAVVTYDPNT